MATQRVEIINTTEHYIYFLILLLSISLLTLAWMKHQIALMAVETGKAEIVYVEATTYMKAHWVIKPKE